MPITITQTFPDSNSLTSNFTQSSPAEGSFTWNATAGLNGGPGLEVSSGADQIWTTKEAYTVAADGVYKVSVFMYAPGGNGYGALGFSTQTQDSSAGDTGPGTGGSPAGTSFGAYFHGSNGGFINNGPIENDGTPASAGSTVAWDNTYNIDSGGWFKFEFTATAKGNNKFDLRLKATKYESDGTTVIGVAGDFMLTDSAAVNATVDGSTVMGPAVTNANVAAAPTLRTFFSSQGGRISAIDDFTIQLGGGAQYSPSPSQFGPSIALRPADEAGNKSATFTEVSGPDDGSAAVTFTNVGTNITDSDSTHLVNLRVSIPVAQVATGDQLLLGATAIDLTTTTATGTVTYGGDTFTYSIADASGTRTVTFASYAPKASYEALLDALKYNNTSNSPVHASTRALTVDVSDGTNNAFTARTLTVTLSANTADDNATPTVDTPTAISLGDTAAADTFSNQTGTLSASDTDGTIASYGISTGTTGGSTEIGGLTYDVSKVGTYGTLYVVTTGQDIGKYVYVPNATAINARSTDASETFTVTATDSNASAATGNATLTVNITGVNDTPTDISLSATSVNQSGGTNATVGTLTSTDADTGQTHTYSLVAGNGSNDTGNASFNISGTTLRANDAAALAAGTYNLNVRTTDNGTGTLTHDKAFTVTVVDNVAPTVTSIVRQTPASSPTNADSLTFRVTFNEAVSGIDTADFSVSGTTGTVASVTQVGSTNAYDVTISGGDLASLNATATLAFAGGQNITDAATTPNALTATTPTGTNDNTFVVDNTAPALTGAVGIASSNATATQAKVGDVVTVTFTTDGTQSGAPTATIEGHTATVTNTTGHTYTATYTLVSGDTEGAVTFSIGASDAAGNAMTAVTAVTDSSAVTFDKTAPTLTISTVATDDKINDAEDESSVTISGTSTGADDRTVSVDVGGTAKTATIASGGAWSVSLTSAEVKALSEGNVSVTADVSDAAGNAATQATKTVVYDRTAPALTGAVSVASSNATATQAKVGDVITVTFTTDGSQSGSPTATILGHTATVTNTTGHTYTATYTLVSGDTEGAVSFSIGASDAAGNAMTAVTAVTDSSAVTFDKTAPTLAISTVATDDKINDSEDESSVTVSGTSAGADGRTLTVDVGGTAKTAIIASGGAWSVSLSSAEVKALTEGNISVTADVSDAAGNAATQATKTVAYDRTAPNAPAAPDMTAGTDSGASSTDDTTSNTTPTFTGTAEAGSTVKLYDTDGTTLLGTTTADGAGAWSITSSALVAGVHSLTVKATDAAGNTSAASIALSVTIDATAPSAPSAPDMAAGSDTGSSSTDDTTSTTTPTFTGTAEAGSTVKLYDTDGTTLLGTTTADGTGAWSITSSALVAGVHSLTVKATDAAGNTSAASIALSVTIDATAPNAPTAPDMTAGTDSGSSSTDDTTSNTTPSFTGTAEAGSTVTLYDTDGTTLLGTTTADGTGAWSITSSALGAGAHLLTVKATDAAGNASTASSALSVTIDASAPSFTPATSTPADNATTFGIGSDIVVKFGERIDASSDLTKVYLKDVATDTLVPATVTLDADGHIVINPTASLSYSKAYYVAWDANALKDAAGNAVSAVADETTYNFTTEAEPPAPAPAPAPAPTTTTVDGTTVQTQTTTQTGTNGTTSTTTTQTVAPVTTTRPEDPNTSNGALADIPLASDSTGAPTIQVSLPVGVGLVSENTSGGNLTLREKLIAASDPRVDGDGPMQEIIANGIDQYVPAVGDQSQVTVRTITLTVAPPTGGGTPTAPTQPIVIRGASGTGEADPANPQRGEALVIDARNLPPGTVLDLSLVEFAIVIGPTTAVGGTGRNYMIGDGSRQFIVLGPEDDIIHGGAGDDTVGSKGGDDQIFGDEGNDWVVGGIGNDTLQGGDGNDILQGGASDAGSWSFKLDAQGQLQASFVPTSTELADSNGFSATGSWAAPAGTNGSGPITDSRFAWVYDDNAVAKDAALLVHALAGRLPTLTEMGTLADGSLTSQQLANAAHAYFANISGTQTATTEAQLQAVITQVWGSGAATNELVQVGKTYLSTGGNWSDIWLALARYSTHANHITDAQGNVSLIGGQRLSDTGWSANSGNDKLFGGAGNDVLVGGNGNDEIDGGSGTDMAVFFGAIGDFEAALIPSTEVGAAAGAHDALIRNKLTGDVDTVRNVELFKVGNTVYTVPPGHPQPADNVYVELSSYVQPVVNAELVGVGFHSEWVQ